MGQLEELVGSATSGDRTLGDVASYEGVEVIPDKYVLADSAERVYANNQNNISSAEGATYIFTHLEVSHNGDSAQKFPSSRTPDTIDLVYDGERVSESMRNDATQSYIVGGKRLTTYGHAKQEAGAVGEVYPGKTVDGWVFHEIASNFDPPKLELRIVWNQQMVGDEGETTHKWTYTSDAEVSIENVEGDGTEISI